MDSKERIDEKENIIARCARIHESILACQNYTYTEIEKLLNEWIKNALEYSLEHPELTNEELEAHLTSEQMILK